MNALNAVEKPEMRADLPAFRIGDTIRVHVKIREGDKERIQVFEELSSPERRRLDPRAP
jgi:large subunit ribosomal protein L19